MTTEAEIAVLPLSSVVGLEPGEALSPADDVGG